MSHEHLPASPVEFEGVRRPGAAARRRYWKSLDELAQAPAFLEFLHREFPEQASMFEDEKGRREFLTLMGASLALAGLTACTKQPEERILPYLRQPETLVPGAPALLRDGRVPRRLRAGAAGREPRGPADQGRGQSRSSREPRRHRRVRAGARASASTIPTARRRCCTSGSCGPGATSARRCASRSRSSRRRAARACAS
jgi:MoCo/4Fe-4S cofactor protein with predicted Tat translocation signal